jgi:hypothetical protein
MLSLPEKYEYEMRIWARNYVSIKKEGTHRCVCIPKRKVHPSFQDLIDSCRSAYAVNDRLDKDRTVHNDSFDSLLLNLSWYKWN